MGNEAVRGLTTPWRTSVGLHLALSVGMLILIALSIALARGSFGFAEVVDGLGSLGRQLFDDVSWLFPSFIATLLAVALIPSAKDVSGERQMTRSREGEKAAMALRVVPVVVGATANTVFVLMAIAVSRYGFLGEKLVAPVGLYIVIAGLGFAITAELVSRDSYRLDFLREARDAAASTAVTSRRLLVQMRPLRRPGRRATLALLLWTVLGAVLALAVLLVELKARDVTYVAGGGWILFCLLLGMTLASTLVTWLMAVTWWSSIRKKSDVALLVYFELLVLVLFGSVAAIVTRAGPVTGAFVVITGAVPMVGTWVPLRIWPAWLRRWTIRAPLLQCVLHASVTRAERATVELAEIAPRVEPTRTRATRLARFRFWSAGSK